MPSPVIIHLTDAHIKDPRRKKGAHQRLRRVAAHIAHTEDLDRVVVCDTGDMGWSMTPEEARKIRWALDPIAGKVRVLASQGNHDHGPKGLVRRNRNSEIWHDLIEDVTGLAPARSPKVMVQRFKKTIFIVANSAHEQTFLARGVLGSDQIDEIKSHVEKANRWAQRSVLLMHHCPSGGNPTKRLSDRHELKAALVEAGGVDLMLVGHLHHDREWSSAFGARRLLSSAPITGEPMRYRRLSWDPDHKRFTSEWVDVD